MSTRNIQFHDKIRFLELSEQFRARNKRVRISHGKQVISVRAELDCIHKSKMKQRRGLIAKENHNMEHDGSYYRRQQTGANPLTQI